MVIGWFLEKKRNNQGRSSKRTYVISVMGRNRKNKNKTEKPVGIGMKVFRNMIGGAAAFILVWTCYKNVDGYTWVYDSLLKGNYKYITDNKHLSADEWREAKMGFSYKYLKHIRDNTPDTAVILMPERDIYFPKEGKGDFEGDMSNKMWRLRVLYPRKIVDASEMENKYATEITHVAIVNGWGYDKLNYEVRDRVQYAVLPVNK